jgi:hypothetical protein
MVRERHLPKGSGESRCSEGGKSKCTEDGETRGCTGGNPADPAVMLLRLNLFTSLVFGNSSRTSNV